MPFESAQWIWCERAGSVNSYAVFRASFSCPAGAGRLFISAAVARHVDDRRIDISLPA